MMMAMIIVFKTTTFTEHSYLFDVILTVHRR